MANLTQKDVLNLARLAKLKLTDSELAQFTAELDEILAYVEQLQSVDVSNLKPTNQVTGLTNIMREDVIIPYTAQPEDLLKNLPQREKNYIKVKRVL
jgi:aspartyl-tRNA(Asn)/glutamyl-tRNA(Gln) amidotransferase subunit C